MSDNRRYTVGIGPGISESSVSPCALNLTSWAPPLPKTCWRPGIMIEIFDLLARRINIDYSILFIDNVKYGVPDHQGNFSGQIGFVQRGEIDTSLLLVGPGDILDQDGHAAVTLLRPMTSIHSVIVVPSLKASTIIDDAITFLKPFDLYLWLLIFAIMTLVAILAKTNQHFLGRYQRILALSAICANLHILNLYKATLVSAYLVKLPKPTLHTFEQVVEELENFNAKLTMPTQQYYRELLHYFDKTSNNDTSVWSRFARSLAVNPPIITSSNKTSHDFIDSNRAFRFAFDNSEVQHMLKEDCNLRLIDVPFASSGAPYATMMVNSDQKELIVSLNEAMDKMNIRSVFDRIFENYQREYLQVQNNCTWHAEYNNNGRNPVTIFNLSGVMFVFGAIVIIATFVLLIELFHQS